MQAGTLRLVADGSCHVDTAFTELIAACSGRRLRVTAPSCHWGAGPEHQPDEVQVVLAGDGDFHALRLVGWRSFPGSDMRLVGRCVDGSEYRLSRYK